jgi:hypothetical protein
VLTAEVGAVKGLDDLLVELTRGWLVFSEVDCPSSFFFFNFF